MVSGRWTQPLLVAIGFGLLVCLTVFLPTFGDRMVNGSAYGSERRMALRPPAFALFGPLQLTWLVGFAGLAVAPLLLAGDQLIVAVVAAVVGGGVVYLSGKVLHQFARRWIVFVPAGFVVHDPLTIVDSVLFRRAAIATLGPALDTGRQSSITPSATTDGPVAERPATEDPATDNPATDGPATEDPAVDDGADVLPFKAESVGDLDLSGGAPGLALAVTTKKPLPVTIRPGGVLSGGSPVETDGTMKNVQTSTVVFTPTLPGALLQEARVRGIKIAVAQTNVSDPA